MNSNVISAFHKPDLTLTVANPAGQAPSVADTGRRLISPAGSASLKAVRGSYAEDSLPIEDVPAGSEPHPSSCTPRVGLRGPSYWHDMAAAAGPRSARSVCLTSEHGLGFGEMPDGFPSFPSGATPRLNMGKHLSGSFKGSASIAAPAPTEDAECNPARYTSVFATALQAASTAAGGGSGVLAQESKGEGEQALAAIRHSYPASALPEDVDSEQATSLFSRSVVPDRRQTTTLDQPIQFCESFSLSEFPSHPYAAVPRPAVPSRQPSNEPVAALVPRTASLTSRNPSFINPPAPASTPRAAQATVGRRQLTPDGAAILQALQASYPHLQEDFAVRQEDDEESRRQPFEPRPTAAVPRAGVARHQAPGSRSVPLDGLFEGEEKSTSPKPCASLVRPGLSLPPSAPLAH